MRAVPEAASGFAALPPGGGVGMAIVLATAPAAAGRPAALLPWADGTVVERLVGQLAALGVGTTVVLARPAFQRPVQDAVGRAVTVKASATAADDLRVIAAAARESVGALLVLYGEMVTHTEALGALLTNRKAGTGILAGGRRRRLAFRVQTQRGRIMSAASPYHSVHRPNAGFLGVLRVIPSDLEQLAATAERLSELVADPSEAWRKELDRKLERWRLSVAEAAAANEDEGGDDMGVPEHDIDEEDEDTGPAVVLSDRDEARVRARAAAAPDDVAALLLLGLVRAGVGVSPVYVRRLFWSRPLSTASAAEVAERYAESNVDRALLNSAVKGNDGFFTTFFVSPYSKYIARWAARRGLTPNQVTTASMLIGALAAAGFATGQRWGLIAGALLLQMSFTADCIDGQLARYTGQFSRSGAWLDSVFDRAKEYLAFAGLAIGAGRMGDDVWLLACAAITLQTVRHTADFSYMSARATAIRATRQPPLEQTLDDAGAAAEKRQQARAAGTPVASPDRRPLAVRTLQAWKRLDRLPAVVWLKRMAAFPIGERFAVISITAALFTPRVTFIALLAWGGFALVYGQTGRILRSIR
jgi:hypothetical protein